ncbi:MAG: hypothetical protein JNL77_07855 [Nitrosomonas sp.]|nr:hypothetical protein [Nitrosomonas sp.]
MGVINFKAETNEIKQWLTASGIHPVDHHYILEKLRTNPDAHLQYLKNARNARAIPKH